jgi:Rieske 2Fe-2S family protein
MPATRPDLPATMLPAAVYTSAEVLAWELRHLYAGSWTCLGRLDELLPGGVTQRGLVVGDVPGLLTRGTTEAGVRLLANTCRHRGHELLPEGGTSDRPVVVCPYHAWSYDLGGRLVAAPGFRDAPRFEPAEHELVELPVALWGGFVFGHGVHPTDSPEVVAFEEHLGAMAGLLASYRLDDLRLGERHTYEVAANWKVIAENYHECYHCPQIHPELCVVTPPTSGDNYDLPGRWVGGRMGPAGRDGHHVPDRRVRRQADPRGARGDRRVPPPAAEPAGLGPSRLRDDAPAGPTGT